MTAPRATRNLDDSDLDLAAQALRALAVRYHNDAKRQRNPNVREGFEKFAAECEGLAGAHAQVSRSVV